MPDLLGLSAGAAGADTAAGAGLLPAAATGGMTLPLSILLALIPSIFQKRFNPLTSMINALGPIPQRYIPGANEIQGVDQAMLKAIMTQMQRGQNWGWPEGFTGNTNFSSLFPMPTTGTIR